MHVQLQDMMIEQIGEGVQELGQLARGLNEELQQQSIMIDGLEERIDTTQAHGALLSSSLVRMPSSSLTVVSFCQSRA